MNSASLIARHLLTNGLTLEFWDHSRPVAGDRFFVRLETRIAIPVRADTLSPELQPHAARVIQVLGEELIFSHQEERNFIALSEAPSILKDMQDRILALAPSYFAHADFAARFIRRKFAEQQELLRLQGSATRRGEGT
jgi:hypothetical protein